MENEISGAGSRPKRNKTLLIIGIVVAVHVVLIGSAFVIQEIHKRGQPGDQAAYEPEHPQLAQENPVKLPEEAAQTTDTQPIAVNSQPKVAETSQSKVAQTAALKAQSLVLPPPAALENKTPAGKEPAKASKTIAKTYIVKKGDTWSGVAAKLKVSVAQLAKDNGLDSKKFLRVGQKLAVKQTVETRATEVAAAVVTPAPKPDSKTAAVKTYVKTAALKKTEKAAAQPSLPSVLYEVKKGDTLLTIATRHAMRLSDLRSINGLKNDKITVGQKLKVLQPGPKPIAHNLLAEVQPRESAPQIHVVAKGETVSHIATKYGVSAGELLRVNNIADPTKVGVGKRIKIPATVVVPNRQDLRQANGAGEVAKPVVAEMAKL